MTAQDKVNILLVDDQPGKLLSYEVILSELGENLIKASSGREALELLLKNDVAVVLVDVCMPELDGFQLATMIHDHPRFQKTSIIFISAIQVTDIDRMRGYEMGAVDYVPVPVIPEVLRAKVKIFAELFRKTNQLEKLNLELEERVALRTAELEASTARLRESEQRRSLALAASNMGSWNWDVVKSEWTWDEGQYRIFGVTPETFSVTAENVRALVHPDDWERFGSAMERMFQEGGAYETEFRVRRPNGEIRWCTGTAAASTDSDNRILCISGVTIDITDRKEAEERQTLLAREVDHRAKNALAVVQSIVRLTRGANIDTYVEAIDGRIKALSRVHTVLSQSRWQSADLASLVSEEFAPYRGGGYEKVMTQGPAVSLLPETAQTLALALHELTTNAAKYGALSSLSGRVILSWDLTPESLELRWTESGGPTAKQPAAVGFGTRIILGSIERQLGGRASFHWGADGLRCEISIPRSDEMKLQDARGGNQRRAEIAGQGFFITGKRIMIVEDEALVAMLLSESVAELGYSVVGPFSKPAAAIAELNNTPIDAAILDINLAGETVYPVATLLKERGVPYIFVTGYGSESIDPEFIDAPVLQKPIEREMLRQILMPRDRAPPHLLADEFGAETSLMPDSEVRVSSAGR